MEQNLKTVAGYAKLKNVTTTTVYNWIKDGKVKSIKIDGITFVIVSQ